MQPHLGKISIFKMPDNFSLGPVMINEYFMSSDEKGERKRLSPHAACYHKRQPTISIIIFSFKVMVC